MAFARLMARRKRLRAAANFQVESLERRVLLSTAIAAFGAQQTFAVGNKPDFVVAADLNRDGKPDVVATKESDNAVGVLLGNGDGTFQSPRSFATGSEPTSLAVADLNGDGILDLAVANLAGSSISVLLGNGNGTFQPQQTLGTGTGSDPYYIAAADVNGDGKADLIVSNFATRTVGVFLGNGNGTFQPQQTMAAGLEPSEVSAADVNGDGRPDLVVANQGAGTVSVFLGNGNGTFQARQIVPAGLTGNFVAVADLNGDGKLDLVTTQSNYSVGVLLGNGNGTFGAVQTFADNSVPTSLAVVDLNGDGKPDIVTGTYHGIAVGVLLGNGNGAFQLPRTFADGLSPFSVTTSDLNRDGRQDLVVANIGGNNIGVLLGDVPPTVLSINRANPAVPSTDANTVSYTVTFNEPVTGVDATDFSLGLTGSVTVSAPLMVSGSGTVYTVTISGISGGGSLTLNLTDNGHTVDALGNPLQAGGTASFQSLRTFVAGVGGALFVTTADLNGDGKPDVLDANFGDTLPRINAINFALGKGDGTLFAPQTVASGNRPVSIVATDLNGDGRTDLVILNQLDNDVEVLLGNGDGTFKSPQTFATGFEPGGVLAADINRDGKQDLIVNDGGAIDVLLGNGDGTFQPAQALDTGLYASSVAVADVNGDGNPDLLAFGDPHGVPVGLVAIMLGNGNGTFRASQTIYSGLGAPYSGALVDINGDGRPDIVLGGLGAYNHAPYYRISVLLGNGNGTFAAHQTFGVAYRPAEVVVADVNGDGKPDLLDVYPNRPQVNVFLGNGNGTFSAPQTFATGFRPYSIAVADMNLDGRPDLVIGGIATTSILLGATDGSFTGQTYTIVPVTDTITGTTGNDTITLRRDFDGTDIDWFMNASSGVLPINDPNGLTINGNGGNDTIVLEYANGTNGSPLPDGVHLNGTFTIDGLQGTNPLTGTTLEIGRSTIFISYSSSDPIATIQGYLHNGYNGGAWNGTPTATSGVITSAAAAANPNHTTGIGYADSADGQGVNITPNTIELMYTLYGDANLDHQVNSADLQILLFNLNRPGSWDQGDFNYDAQVNSADLQALLFTLNTSLGSQTTSLAVAATPPSTVASTPSESSDSSPHLMPAINATGSATTPSHHPQPAKAAVRKRR